MKNKLTDLNDYLFEAIEKIQDAETADERKSAMAEGRVVASIGAVIVNNANVQLKAVSFKVKEMPAVAGEVKFPDILAIEESKSEKTEK